MVSKYPREPEVVELGEDDDEMITIYGYLPMRCYHFLYWLSAILTIGLLQAAFVWRPQLQIYLLYRACPLSEATRILVKDYFGQICVESVETVTIPSYRENKPSTVLRRFYNRNVYYIFDDDKQRYERLRAFTLDTTCGYFHNQCKGWTPREREIKKILYKPNIIEIEERPIHHLVVYEALNPIYAFCTYALIVWCAQNYVLYSGCIFCMAVISVSLSVWETRKQTKTLRRKVVSQRPVTVVNRNGAEEEVSSADLVPGDIIIIPQTGAVMECDAVLLNGSCVVNESMLTGESVPIRKTPVANDLTVYSSVKHKCNTLFCGTQILQANGKGVVKALVLRTGFATAKGELVRSILFPKPVDIKFYEDTIKVLGISLVIGAIGSIYTAIVLHFKGASSENIMWNALDIFTFTIPVALPTAMTIGNAYAQGRLKEEEIYCLSLKYINFCGSLDVVCFDKTGTLTNEGLTLWGVSSVEYQRFHLNQDPSSLPVSPFTIGMATCHSLAKIDGEVVGYPLDLVIFQSTKWEFFDHDMEGGLSVVSPRDDTMKHRYAIVKQYTFSSALQCMTVVVENLAESGAYFTFTKGSPEKLKSICLPETVPTNFDAVLQAYTRQGFRVIALAFRPLLQTEVYSLQAENRCSLESNLTFLGIIILKNTLKPETIPALEKLTNADIRTVMVTGDNLLTALKVGHDCNILKPDRDTYVVNTTKHKDKLILSYQQLEGDNSSTQGAENFPIPDTTRDFQLAIDGKNFALIHAYDSELLQKIVLKGAIFARMLPEQKVQLVEALQGIGYSVGMCGDGANDCGALKTANAGISLSVAEASVASPFTSKKTNISCVPKLIREGRCALVTAFGVFKHLLATHWLYFTLALLLFWNVLDFYDSQYVFMDLACLIFPTIFFGNVAAYAKLVPRQPPTSLFSFHSLFSVLSFLILNTAFAVGLLKLIEIQPWYMPFEYKREDELNFESYDNTAVYLYGCFSFACSVISFSWGAPYRQPLYKYKVFLVGMTVLFFVVIGQFIYPPNFAVYLFGMKMAPSLIFRCIMLLYCLAANLTIIIWETYVVQEFLWNFVVPKIIARIVGPGTKYEQLQQQIDDDSQQEYLWSSADRLSYRSSQHAESELVIPAINTSTDEINLLMPRHSQPRLSLPSIITMRKQRRKSFNIYRTPNMFVPPTRKVRSAVEVNNIDTAFFQVFNSDSSLDLIYTAEEEKFIDGGLQGVFNEYTSHIDLTLSNMNGGSKYELPTRNNELAKKYGLEIFIDDTDSAKRMKNFHQNHKQHDEKSQNQHVKSFQRQDSEHCPNSNGQMEISKHSNCLQSEEYTPEFSDNIEYLEMDDTDFWDSRVPEDRPDSGLTNRTERRLPLQILHKQAQSEKHIRRSSLPVLITEERYSENTSKIDSINEKTVSLNERSSSVPMIASNVGGLQQSSFSPAPKQHQSFASSSLSSLSSPSRSQSHRHHKRHKKFNAQAVTGKMRSLDSLYNKHIPEIDG
ncbi:putative cation-transporting ATPase 13A4 [Tubulanus polymorphus]|uniref:putative cation-transporting ATPase 13A4 n=1 Tax=Tubulanus polymorphus TaxID=672921 RepID=UPI003DA51BE4